MMEGFSDYILVTIDMADPTKPKSSAATRCPA